MKSFLSGKTAVAIKHLFQVLLVTYLILLLVEELFTGSVSLYLNLNYLLIIVIVVGILDVFSDAPKIEEKPVTKKDYLFVLILGVLGFFIIKYKTDTLGWLSWVISIIAGILITLLSILVLEDNENDESS